MSFVMCAQKQQSPISSTLPHLTILSIFVVYDPRDLMVSNRRRTLYAVAGKYVPDIGICEFAALCELR